MTKVGHLSVKINSDSIFFGNEVPVEVRDFQMRLIQQSSDTRQFELPVGLYEVSAVLEDGRKHKKLCQVTDDEPTIVELSFSDQAPPPESPVQEGAMDIPYERPRYTQKMEAISGAGPESSTGVTAQLIAVKGALLIRESHLLWVFGCSERIDSVPTALIQIGDRKIQISLPISPEHEFPNNSCVVKVEETRTGAHANAWISKERTVANGLQNMMASGNMLNAADVANKAVELMRDKYSDPAGAALGALILSKVGRLERWAGWVENLARDFDWLPDGKVLQASLLCDKESSRSRALDLLLKASTQRMLFAENYSLLLDLLRRWSRPTDPKARQLAVSGLASQATYIDWESICLSNAVQAEESV
jgi:hypothetical protein